MARPDVSLANRRVLRHRLSRGRLKYELLAVCEGRGRKMSVYGTTGPAGGTLGEIVGISATFGASPFKVCGHERVGQGLRRLYLLTTGCRVV